MKDDYLIANGDNFFFLNYSKKHWFQEYKTRQKIKKIVKINLFLSYKEITKHNVLIFSIIKLKINI